MSRFHLIAFIVGTRSFRRWWDRSVHSNDDDGTCRMAFDEHWNVRCLFDPRSFDVPF